MSEPRSTAERLLEAAIELLDAGGEAAVRIDKVSAAAGVTAPSVYYFYGDREGLVIAAQAERYRRTLMVAVKEQAAMTRLCKTRDEFVALIVALVHSLGTDEGVQRRRVRMEVLGSAASRPALRTLLEAADVEASSGIAELINIARDRGWVGGRFDADVFGLWWYGMINGRYLVEGNRSAEDRAKWDDIASEAIVRLFGNPGATAG